MKPKATVLPVLLALFTGFPLSGCDQGKSAATKAQDHIFKSQEKALEQAKQVEQLMQDAEQERRKKMEEMMQ